MLWIGIYVNVLISLWAYLRHRLSFNGALTAMGLGFVTLLWGHDLFFILLMVFFLSSIFIRKVMLKLFPHHFPSKSHKKGMHAPRTYVQVLCNGGVIGVLSILYPFYPSIIMLYAAGVSMAAATADTWASELGSLSDEPPRTLFTRQYYPKGSSGAVTSMGLWASMAGSLLIGLVVSLYVLSSYGFNGQWVWLSLSLVGFGFLGSLMDSLLGEFIQAKYIDGNHHIYEDHPPAHAKLSSGWAWVDNNLVNLFANIITVALFFYFNVT